MDSELITRARAGDQDAHAELYPRVLKMARRCVVRILRKCPEEIDGVAHDTAVKVLMSLDKFRGDCAIETWTFQVARNNALMYLRRNDVKMLIAKTDQLEGSDDDSLGLLATLGSDDLGFASVVSRDYVSRLFRRLRPKDVELLRLCFIADMSMKELALHYDISVSAIKTRLIHARRRARVVMNDLNKPVDKQKCVECEKENRFRFADVVVDGRPLCKWCTAGVPTTKGVAPRRTFHRVCQCKPDCGVEFTSTAASQKYADGHRAVLTPKQRTAIAVQPQLVQMSKPVDVTNETVTITVSAVTLDQMWRSLPLQDKARAFEFLLRA